MASLRCHLLELPPELRLRIYDFLFPPSKCYFDFGACCRSVRTRKNWAYLRQDKCLRLIPVALLQTCRTIHEESAPILYDRTMFEFNFFDLYDYGHGGGQLCALHEFRISASIQHVYMRFNPHLYFSDYDKDLGEVLGTVFRQLSFGVSLRRLHLEIHDFWNHGFGYTTEQRKRCAVHRFEKLQCEGTVTMSAENASLVVSARTQYLRPEFYQLVKWLKALVQHLFSKAPWSTY